MHPGIDRPVGRRSFSDRLAPRHLSPRGIVRGVVFAILIVGLIVAGGQGGAGHSVGHFPSYYPHEIRIETIEPAAAAKGLSEETLHAYVGAVPTFAGPIPRHIESVRSLGSIFVLSFRTTSTRFATADARCTAARGVMAVLPDEKEGGFIFPPYPVTPYHADYLHHLDRVEAAMNAVGGTSAPASEKFGAKGRLATSIVRARWQLTEDADAVLEEIPADELLASMSLSFDGWSGPPWAKEGWFEAHRLLAPSLDGAAREAMDDDYARLVHGETLGLAERADLERSLVATLTRGCSRLVVGYTSKEEFVDAAYPAGIENVAYDSLSGLNSPIFLRTVKLKEYPWNGNLHLGVRERSAGAWNPVAGFTDPMGRLIWSAIGDPAMIQFPFNASWMHNRVQSVVTKVEGQSGGIRVPPDARRPRPGTGTLDPVGASTFASAKVVYEVRTSPFEDGSEMDVADVIYPFMFTYRWGANANSGGDNPEPRLEQTLAAMQEHVAGLKVVRVERTKHVIAENWEIFTNTPVVEVYLRGVPHDELQVAAMVPPWSTIPWHLLALMEEAVKRGYAAFSKNESERRRIPWMDLVRDQDLRAKLLPLIAQFERESYRPEPLTEFVTAEAAQARWRALAAFAEKNGHFLVTNGPYRLAQWNPESVVLQAVREVTYPLGFGTFDRFVHPPRAVVESIAHDADTITVRASTEMILKVGRDYKLTKEPLLRTTLRGTFGLLVVSRYLLIGPDGKVRTLDKMHWEDDGRFTIKLPKRLAPGEYTVNLAIFLDGNSMTPSAKSLRLRVGGTGSPN